MSTHAKCKLSEIYVLKVSNEAIIAENKSRAAKKAARLAERVRAYAAHLAERGIPYETATRAANGLIVRRRGNCPNYQGDFSLMLNGPARPM